MSTTIQISDGVKKSLEKMRVYERETYNEIIENMIEDQMEINEKTKKELSEEEKAVILHLLKKWRKSLVYEL